MNTGNRQGFSRCVGILDLVACFLGVSLATAVYARLASGQAGPVWPLEWIRQVACSAITVWLAVAFSGGEWGGGIRLWIDRLLSAIGFNLIVQYGLDYVFHFAPSPWPIAVFGSTAALVLMAALQHWLYPRWFGSRSILLVGNNAVTEALAAPLRGRLVGIVQSEPSVAHSSLPVLGDASSLSRIVEQERPDCIVLTDRNWQATIPPRQLLALRYSNIAVEDGYFVYEDILQRFCCDRPEPFGSLAASPVNANRSAMALQAVYTNLIGLGLLLVISPFLILLTLALTVATGRLAIETQECLGFQRIPFRRLRFRTRCGDGSLPWFGRFIEKVHLKNLPRLINVVRGEMALFGPPPVQRYFAERLGQLLPGYSYRFTVKPGLLGWSQCNLRDSSSPDELLRLEYDLYYAREESPSLDLDILIRTLFRSPLEQPAMPRHGKLASSA